MSRVSTFGLAVTGLLALAPAGLAAQGTDTNPDNTPNGTTSAEFLLFGAGARGSAMPSPRSPTTSARCTTTLAPSP